MIPKKTNKFLFYHITVSIHVSWLQVTNYWTRKHMKKHMFQQQKDNWWQSTKVSYCVKSFQIDIYSLFEETVIPLGIELL